MKTLLLKAIVCCAAILPISQAQAGKLFGEFAPGKTFTLTVTEVVSVKGSLGGVSKKAAVPAGIPKFTKGQKVKFTIGAKGQLTGNGFSIPFETDGGTSNAYVTLPTATKTMADIGTVYKTETNRPSGAALSFFKVRMEGFNSTVWSVNYVFAK